MASLRFTFDGARRSGPNQGDEKGRPLYPYPMYMGRPFYPRPMPFFGGTYPQGEYSPSELSQEKEELENKKQDESPNVIEQEDLSVVEPETEKEKSDDIPPEEAKEDSRDDDPAVNVSEKLINTMGTAEAGLNSIRGKVDLAKNLFDDLTFKLDSATQILDVLRSNEERRLNGPQVQTVSPKATKDTIDELLELLQTPAIQNILRQVMLTFLAKK